MITIKKPGKLFIAGEYSVTRTGAYGIIAPVDRFITVTVEKSDQGVVKSFGGQILYFQREKALGTPGPISFSSDDGKWSYVKSALLMAEKYLFPLIEEFDNYNIVITSELDSETGKKYGLGSSGAVTVALVEAIVSYYGVSLSKDKIFKISALASLENSPLSSFGDICASAYESLVLYRKFDVKSILHKVKKESIYDLVNSPWPLLEIKEISFPEAWNLYVGWTGVPASSIKMVDRMEESSSYKSYFGEFSKRSDAICLKIYKEISERNYNGLKESLKQARLNLLDLSEKLSLDIETNKLEKLTQLALGLGLCSKLSGAGGGDCGIAISDNKKIKEDLKNLWEENGIDFLEISIYRSKIDV